MSGGEALPPPGRVPVLTEVIDLDPWTGPPAPVERAEGLASSPLPNEEQLVRRVLGELQQQIDVMLEYRIRESLAPLLARAADNVVRDARSELASTLRDVVARAVAAELGRLRGR